MKVKSVPPSDLKWISDFFQSTDSLDLGTMHRSELTTILEDAGCVHIKEMIDSWLTAELGGDLASEMVNCVDFLEWLLRDSDDAKVEASTTIESSFDLSKSDVLPDHVAPQLEEIASSLMKIASSVWSSDNVASTALAHHAAALRKLCGPSALHADIAQDPKGLERPTSAAPSSIAAEGSCVFPRQISGMTNSTHWFRDEATRIVQKTGRAGELVEDLQEVSVADLKDEDALACWRSCYGLRLYRSQTVTQALRLICSAQVPGLGGVSYLDVFKKLTSSGWKHHIFLFGGLVRDIIRRKVGNDIDITYSAPAAELENLCKEKGWTCTLDGDYILIGEEQGEEYCEGMVVTHNGVTPPENSDFSFNWVFYDFVNDVIIDKTGWAVPAVIANRCEIPCVREKWHLWLQRGGSRVLFRYFKFLVRGYEYDDQEMKYIGENLLDFWRRDANETVEIGKDTLSSLIASGDAEKIERLRQLVFIAFKKANGRPTSASAPKRHSFSDALGGRGKVERDGCFLSAASWWRKGWLRFIPDIATA
jgi:hypothetical protein